MDKRTLYAVIIATIIIIVGFSVQRAFFTDTEAPPPAEQGEGDAASDAPADGSGGAADGASGANGSGAATADARRAAPQDGITAVIDQQNPPVCNPYFNNGTIEAMFSATDAGITSYRLLQHLDNERPVELIFKGSSNQNPFTILVGDQEGYALTGAYDCRTNASNNGIEFSGRFIAPALQPEPFDVVITYTFSPDEYLFQQQIEFRNSVNKPVPLGASNGGAYTLFVGPQIGPAFEELDNRFEYRKYITLDGRDRNSTRSTARRSTVTSSRNADWAAISGKYFALAALPHAGVDQMIISSAEREGVPAASTLYITRSPIQSSAQIDTYRFYFGPKQRRELIKYDEAEDNALGIEGLNLRRVQDSRPLIGWLEAILKAMLTLFYAVIPNYGIAIIILTVVVKILLTPLTRKSQQSMERMQALSPKIKELRERHSNDKQKLNVEMAHLYKKEKVNPAGGCLPILLQMPFFLAMFGIFNNHYELRNAVFIRGWIDDLARPESILNFGEFTIPLLGWNDLRLLPILYAVTQLASGYLSRNPSQTAQQNKMTLIMPLVLFFVLYNLPSGLLVYWIVTNLLMVVQQLITRTRKKIKAQ